MHFNPFVFPGLNKEITQGETPFTTFRSAPNSDSSLTAASSYLAPAARVLRYAFLALTAGGETTPLGGHQGLRQGGSGAGSVAVACDGSLASDPPGASECRSRPMAILAELLGGGAR